MGGLAELFSLTLRTARDYASGGPTADFKIKRTALPAFSCRINRSSADRGTVGNSSPAPVQGHRQGFELECHCAFAASERLESARDAFRMSAVD
mgnify:CR=1 FL=1